MLARVIKGYSFRVSESEITPEPSIRGIAADVAPGIRGEWGSEQDIARRKHRWVGRCGAARAACRLGTVLQWACAPPGAPCVRRGDGRHALGLCRNPASLPWLHRDLRAIRIHERQHLA